MGGPTDACGPHDTEVSSSPHRGVLKTFSASEGWDALARWLYYMPDATRRGPEVGPDERGMPLAMLERVRSAALRCLAATAADAGARPVMLTLVWEVAEAVAPLLGNAQAAPLREAAAKVGPICKQTIVVVMS